MSETTSRLVPDSECKQGKCGCTTTGCYGKCALEMVPSITMEVCTVPYAELQAELAAKQAEIDRPMLKYCPDEMTVEQKRRLADSKQAVTWTKLPWRTQLEGEKK